jgi:hypothetical protein
LKSVRNGRQERSTSAWRAKRPERIYRKNVALPDWDDEGIEAQGDDNGDYDQICGSGEMTGEDWDDSNSYVIMLKTSLTCIVVTSFL